ncbi:MAG: DNA-binding response regulator [Bacillota bacterium]|nr:DNA-binding response regulator [Bacillota bacterium]REJ36961.1 MAG: DNA-binding response regulator [Bacillota bacterium]
MGCVQPIKVVIVDDHEVVRVGLKSLLNRVADLEVVGEAGSAAEAEQVVEQVQPDVVVMDIRMPGGSGIEACRSIRSRWPHIRVIMLTSYSDDEAVIGSVMAGASGYVLKQIGTQELVDAIRRVSRGESLLDPGVTGKILERVRGGSGLSGTDGRGTPEALTEQEERILALIAEGKTNREIANALYLSEKTVRNYVSNILAKLQLHNRAEAAAWAVRRGLDRAPRGDR